MNTLVQVPHCVSSEFSARAKVWNECASVLEFQLYFASQETSHGHTRITQWYWNSYIAHNSKSNIYVCENV